MYYLCMETLNARIKWRETVGLYWYMAGGQCIPLGGLMMQQDVLPTICKAAYQKIV